MKILVLDKNDNMRTTVRKVNEEASELVYELMVEDLKNIDNRERIISETLDVIQVCVGILDKYRATEQDVEKHNNKLLNRGWGVKQVYNII